MSFTIESYGRTNKSIVTAREALIVTHCFQTTYTFVHWKTSGQQVYEYKVACVMKTGMKEKQEKDTL